MTKGRAAPPRQPTPRELEHAERRAALLSLDVGLMRTWAARWGVPLIDADDDSLLWSAHAARLRDESLPREARLLSARWLAERGDAVAAGVVEQLSPLSNLPDA